MMFKKILYIFPALVFFAGCSKITPPLSEYRIDVKIKPQELKSTGCKKSSLKVAQVFSSSDLMALDMNYAQGKYKQFMFSQSKWATSPNRAITSEILNYMKSTELFKNVQMSKSRTRNNMLLETNVEDFMQYFSEDELTSYVKVSISFTLVDMSNNHVIDTKTFNLTKKVNIMNAHGGVIALNSAFEDILQKSGVWVNEVCK